MSIFPQFPLLPTELQLHIWYFALEVQEGQIVPIEHLRYGRPRKFKPHALYFVNCDSRRTYLEFHKKNLARYPRLGTVVFDPRIDIVLVEVGSFKRTKIAVRQIRDAPEASTMKDARNVAIRTYYEDDVRPEALRMLDNSFGNIIARVLPSLETFIYDPGSELRLPGYGPSYGGNNGTCDHNLPSSVRRVIARRRADFQELLVQRTCEILEEYKRSENPEWNIPKVLLTLDIHGETVDVQRILRQR
ncbi:hypothetical protein EAF04_008425 [Stromatinia cepivora]|nr:hypothetical protein EAF04_008425 [Stromatinia cepivora]